MQPKAEVLTCMILINTIMINIKVANNWLCKLATVPMSLCIQVTAIKTHDESSRRLFPTLTDLPHDCQASHNHENFYYYYTPITRLLKCI
jgi:hypothetical protein